MNTLAAETLLTCPDCGQTGFLARGLAAHRGSKHCQRRHAEVSREGDEGAGGAPALALRASRDPLELLDPAALTVHPLLAHIPEYADHDDAFTTLLNSIREHGVLAPALVDSHHRIVCGRHRRRVAVHLGIQLPVRRVDDARAAQVILAELCVARNLTKSARAYVAVPLLAPALAEARERRIANLKYSGTRFAIETSLSDVSMETGPSRASIASGLGIGQTFLRYAEKLREQLAKVEKKCGAEIAREIERQLLAGDYDLGEALRAAANHLNGNTSGGNTNVRRQYDVQFAAHLKKTVLHWDKATPAQRTVIASDVRKFRNECPPELCAVFKGAFK